MSKSLHTCIRLLISFVLYQYCIQLFAGVPNPVEYENYIADNTTALHSATSLFNQAKQISNQLESIKYQVKNTGHVSDYQWQNISSLIQKLDSTTRQGQALSYASSNLDAQFKQKYPNYVNSSSHQTNYQQAYQDWSSTTLDTLRSTLDASGMNVKNFQTEQQTLAQLRAQGQSATGRMQALQVSSEISLENVNQLQELKRLVVGQTNAQDAYMAYKVSKDSYNEKAMQAIDNEMPSTFPKYHNNAKFGVIK